MKRTFFRIAFVFLLITGISGVALAQVALPPVEAQAKERLASSPRHGEWVSVPAGGGDKVEAWVVYPERKDRAPVVLVVHEIFGLSDWVRSVADQLAAEGFIAIAPDLITMRRTGDLTREWPRDSGNAAIRSLTPDEVQRSLDAVAKHAMSLPGARQTYGVVGFCWGGGQSFRHAVHARTLGAAVVFYGPPPPADQLSSIRAPVLGLYGGNDARINTTIPATDSAMKALGKSYEHQIFDGAGHGFLRAQEGAEGANLKASEQAWPRAVAFLKAKLGA
jgi:carboxymethylenebutenolidase